MNRAGFCAQLAALELSGRPAEEPFRQRMIALLDSTAGCFLHSSFPAHFTGSALVVSSDGRRALLHHHRKLNRWLQFGGHCDGEEDVLRVAQREAREESGIEGLAAVSAQPFDLDIHEIPANGGEPAHFHYDVRHMFIAPKNATAAVSEESHALRWFTPEETLALPLDDGLRRLVAKWQTWLAQRAG